MSPATSKYSVLVIDDDLVMRELLPALLAANGHYIVTTESQEEAMQVLGGGAELDVVLTDLNLPQTNVRELISTVRGYMPAGAVLLGMSASQPAVDVRSSLDGFLDKPFGATDLENAVQRARTQERTETAEAKEAEAYGPDVLDENTYKRLASSLPAASLCELYRITLQDVGHRTELIRSAAAGGDDETCRREAHAIKGACGMVGAMELRNLAAGIEGGSAVNAAALDEFAAGCERLQRMLYTLPPDSPNLIAQIERYKGPHVDDRI